MAERTVGQQMATVVLEMLRKSESSSDGSFPHCSKTETAPETSRSPKRLSHWLGLGDAAAAHGSTRAAPELALVFPGCHDVMLLGSKAVECPASATMDPEEEANATLAGKDMAPYELIVRPQDGPDPSQERT